MSEIELTSIHAGREIVYSSFADIFLFQPTLKQYDILKEVIPPLTEMSNSADNVLMSEGVEYLNRFLSSLNSLTGEQLDEFKLNHLRKYTRLFCLNEDVPIAESYYTSTDKLMMQDSRDQVLKMYKENGFEYQLESNEPDDHIGIELLFLSYLSNKLSTEVFASDEYVRVLKLHIEFLNIHVLSWIHGVFDKLKEFNESSDFYLPITKFIYGYTIEDRAFLEDILEQINDSRN